MQPTHTPRLTLRIANHVRAVRVDEQVILLDLRHDKYIGVGGLQASLLGHAVEDWPYPAPASTADVADGPVTEVISSLVRQGLLEDGTPSTTPRPELDEATEGVDRDDGDMPAGMDWLRIFRLWRCAAVASCWLKRRPLADIAAAVADLRSQRANKPTPTGSDAMIRTVQKYSQVKPFVLTAHDKCLHESLTLIKFLAADGLFPHWVIGVKTRPFGAHSWVQSGTTVLTDLPEHVRHFTPILVV